MDKADYSEIDPLRVPEARRRVATINEFLAISNPTSTDMIIFANRIGLSRFQFSRLVRTWREHRRPELLVVSRRGAASRDYGIARSAIAIAREVITNAGASAELATVAVEIEQLCKSEGVPPPSRPTIWNYLRQARAASNAPVDGPPRIIIGRMWFHLPVSGRSDTDMPSLLAAILLPERLIVVHRISLDAGEPPSIRDLVSDLMALRTEKSEIRPLLIEAADRRVAESSLVAARLCGIRSHKFSLQREVARAFGGRLGRLPAIYKRGKARPGSKRVIQRQDERISPAAALAAIEEAIDAHNHLMTGRQPPYDIGVSQIEL